MASPQHHIERFRAYLKRRNYAAHTIESYTLDLQLFFAAKEGPPATVTHLDVEQFVAQQHAQGLRPTTLNRRLYSRFAHFYQGFKNL
jgi:site-specific recombinase XerD